ncbi:hypothetical protein PISMIDRAFT_690932 [Pisolithus microcarpus 441]|uniref:Uncharacterized protein n=1 Tax=Pisolithus microcarpus 441 TaxID=765257 RepID=A0A0C9YJS9_9AGAM|nr:hypothetical protein PISMIDRAFT_690932 [Pisolithus microcarpus 441]
MSSEDSSEDWYIDLEEPVSLNLAEFVPCKATVNCCTRHVAPAKPKQPKSSQGKSKRPPAMNKNAHKYTKHVSTTAKK